MTPIHIQAVDWALSKGYVMSVTDYCCSVFNDDPDDDEWDIQYSSDRAEILSAIDGTDLPNVYVFGIKFVGAERKHITTFSVIDEGIPEESINDYTIPREGGSEFDDWYKLDHSHE